MWSLVALFVSTQTVAQPRHFKRADFQTTTPMVHDPVMALEDSTWHIFATGMGIQQMTSKDRKTWTVKADPVMTVIPKWAHDSVPGGLLSTRSLASGLWDDEGCIVCSHEGRDNWNAIDPNFVIDDQDQPWLVWGSFWDGIQLVRLDTTMHVAKESGARSQESVKPKTIARRFNLTDPDGKKALSVNPNPPKNPTSDFAGPNAIEAPFIFKHDGWYYLFVSWDYCCQGAKSNYRVAVGRSRNVEGPYLDPEGKDMRDGGGKIFLEGDKKEYEAAGHCAAYNIDGQDIFICHGYSVAQEGASVLIQRPISWTPDGWPTLNKTK